MKKILLILAISFMFLTGCGGVEVEKETNQQKDELKFKEEYEAINGQPTETEGVNYSILDIPTDNKIVYVDEEEVLEILNEGTGIIYFGFPECPWCRSLLPTFIDTVKKSDIDKIYYANILESRDVKSLDENDKVITEKEGTETYFKIIEKLDKHLGNYTAINSDEKRLYFPSIAYVKDGEVTGFQIGTVDSQTDPYEELNKEQVTELEEMINNNIEKISSLVCTDGSDNGC